MIAFRTLITSIVHTFKSLAWALMLLLLIVYVSLSDLKNLFALLPGFPSCSLVGSQNSTLSNFGLRSLRCCLPKRPLGSSEALTHLRGL